MLLTTNPAKTAPRNPIHALWENALTTTTDKCGDQHRSFKCNVACSDLEEIIAPSVVKSTGVALRNIAK